MPTEELEMPTTTTTVTTDPVTTILADIESPSFWTNPASYIAIASYVLPVLALILHKNTAQAAQVVAMAAPVVATAVALILHLIALTSTNKAKASVQIAALQANSSVAQAAAARLESPDAKLAVEHYLAA